MRYLFMSAILVIGLKLSGQTPIINLSDDELEISQKSSSRKFFAGDQWQSFTFLKSGMFSLFRAYHYSGSESGNLYLYEGEGTTGKLLHEQSYTADGTDFLFFRLNTTIPVSAGKTYTVRLSKFRWFFSPDDAYSGGKSSKNSSRDMLFEVYLHKPKQVLVNGEVSAATISHGTVQSSTENNNRYLEYTINNLDPIALGNNGNSLIHLRLKPRVFIKDGLLYVHFTSGNSTVDIQNYQDKWNDQNYYIFNISTSISVDDQPAGNVDPIEFELWDDGPTNLNKEGKYTDMKQFSVGISGADPGMSYTVGSTTTKTVRDFDFTNAKYGHRTGFSWTLSETAMESMIKWEAGQISALTTPPVLARSSFPLYCQALFKSREPNVALSDFVNVRFFTAVTLNRSYLIKNQDSEVGAFFEGFGFLVNPKTYKGELAYRIGLEPMQYIKYVDIRLDLRPFKQ